MDAPLRQWRERAKLSQTDLAKAVKRTKSHISNIEAGRSGMSPELMKSVARVLSKRIGGSNFSDVLVGIATGKPPADLPPLQSDPSEHCTEAA